MSINVTFKNEAKGSKITLITNLIGNKINLKQASISFVSCILFIFLKKNKVMFNFIDKFFRISITIETVVILHCKD